MQFELLADLPQTDRAEIARIQAIDSGLRSTGEAAFLAARLPYLTNKVYRSDSDGLYLDAEGNTVPQGYAGFKKGCLFRKLDATYENLYVNIGDENTSYFGLLSVSGVDTSQSPSSSTSPSASQSPSASVSPSSSASASPSPSASTSASSSSSTSPSSSNSPSASQSPSSSASQTLSASISPSASTSPSSSVSSSPSRSASPSSSVSPSASPSLPFN